MDATQQQSVDTMLPSRYIRLIPFGLNNMGILCLSFYSLGLLAIHARIYQATTLKVGFHLLYHLVLVLRSLLDATQNKVRDLYPVMTQISTSVV